MADVRFSNGFCNACDREVLAVAEGPSHRVWFLIGMTTFIGFFIWWYLTSKDFVWRCSRCGAEQDWNEDLE